MTNPTGAVMSGNKIIEGAKEAVAVARGEQPAARIIVQGHAYVPESELAALRERVKEFAIKLEQMRARKEYQKDRAVKAKRAQRDLANGVEHWKARAETAERKLAEAREALKRLANAKALSGVRKLVAGWNGEDRPLPYNERHPSNLGATLPKTTCGAVYELDEALTAARAITEE